MKRLVVVPVLAISVGLGVGCTDKAAQTALAELRAQAAVEQQNEALVRSVFDKLDNRDDTVFQELYAPEYGWHTPANNPNALTREQEAEFVKLLWAGFPDMRWDIAEVITRGDRVVVRFTVKGTHQAEYQGIPATGNKVEIGGLWVGRIKNGRLIEAREEADVMGLMQQLGMELKPKAPTK
jgi:steroid delta-isomerase-like uncharacterized protein